MKSVKILSLVLFVCIRSVSAQDTTLVLTPDMLDKDSIEIFISEMKGWLFKQGNDTSWAKKEIDLSGWKRLMPTELSEQMVDKDDRLEGWFRIKLRPDSAFGETPLGFRISTWAASDLYIDGKWIASFGNTGLNGAPYEENRFAANLIPVAANLKPGNDYTIALHVVDYLSPLAPYELKAKQNGLKGLIRVVVPKYYSTIVPWATDQIYISTIVAAVSALLSLLFWLLYFQNRREKNLLLFSLASTALTFSLISQAFLVNAGAAYGGISYGWFTTCVQLSGNFGLIYFMLVPLILARIFKRRFSRFISGFYFLIIFVQIIGSFGLISVNQKLGEAFGILVILIIIISSIYYISSSWKSLKGAQWAITIGLFVSLVFLFLLIMFQFFSPGTIIEVINLNLIYAICYLPLPFALMIYVVMRFKEINQHVQENAKQLIQMSEEKKEQALNQQRILQDEVTRQTAEIRTTLDNLKSTQSQLIQSEKMASLGELTAGIAHEIQNPLNFVNNFSEVSRELIAEMREELAVGSKDSVQLAVEIAEDISKNLDKINHHGKRADGIVKSMLQHSRLRSSGQKEPTDLNALCEEYLRLSYHGLRAKDNSFSAAFKTETDPHLGLIPVKPEDIGRVLLNIINNAFYSVAEKSKTADPSYRPSVIVATYRGNKAIEISVSDNGKGIPDTIKDKIFQPFFTTKPAGKGTGLGLSVSYDIVKAHGGELKIETKEGEGSTFVILLPIV